MNPKLFDMKNTPFLKFHEALGARIIPFAGYNMPVEYTGITEEHITVREKAGVFDVSHMGEFWVNGPAALAFLQHITSNDVSALIYPEDPFLYMYRLVRLHCGEKLMHLTRSLIPLARATCSQYKYDLDNISVSRSEWNKRPLSVWRYRESSSGNNRPGHAV